MRRNALELLSQALAVLNNQQRWEEGRPQKDLIREAETEAVIQHVVAARNTLISRDRLEAQF